MTPGPTQAEPVPETGTKIRRTKAKEPWGTKGGQPGALLHEESRLRKLKERRGRPTTLSKAGGGEPAGPTHEDPMPKNLGEGRGPFERNNE